MHAEYHILIEKVGDLQGGLHIPVDSSTSLDRQRRWNEGAKCAATRGTGIATLRQLRHTLNFPLENEGETVPHSHKWRLPPASSRRQLTPNGGIFDARPGRVDQFWRVAKDVFMARAPFPNGSTVANATASLMPTQCCIPKPYAYGRG
jgi:hypothetical protein